MRPGVCAARGFSSKAGAGTDGARAERDARKAAARVEESESSSESSEEGHEGQEGSAAYEYEEYDGEAKQYEMYEHELSEAARDDLFGQEHADQLVAALQAGGALPWNLELSPEDRELALKLMKHELEPSGDPERDMPLILQSMNVMSAVDKAFRGFHGLPTDEPVFQLEGGGAEGASDGEDEESSSEEDSLEERLGMADAQQGKAKGKAAGKEYPPVSQDRRVRVEASTYEYTDDEAHARRTARAKQGTEKLARALADAKGEDAR